MKIIKYILSTFILTISLLIIFIIVDFNNNKHINVSKNTTKILFYSDECSDCKSIAFKLIYNKYINQITLININSSKNKHFIDDYGLNSVPTYIEIRKDGTFKKFINNKSGILKILK